MKQMKKTLISAVVAMDEKRGIGKDNRIPWHLKADLIHLKKLTQNKIVILGRKSYESMVYYYEKSGREMPAKLYAIVTRDAAYKPARSNTQVFSSPQEAVQQLSVQEDEIFVIGGAQIFQEVFDQLNRLYITRVNGDFHADTFFPDYSNFTKIISKEIQIEKGLQFTWLTLEK
jgi:dihydrofolate reductase